MYPDIIIPTCKPDVNAQIDEIKRFTPEINVIATCEDTSAARNRNLGLSYAKSDLVIMMDDDITGFYKGWIDDLMNFWDDSFAIMSVRLLEPNGKLGYMLSENDKMTKGAIVIEKREVPTACIVFSMTGQLLTHSILEADLRITTSAFNSSRNILRGFSW